MSQCSTFLGRGRRRTDLCMGIRRVTENIESFQCSEIDEA